ncbi:MAG: hypothetical protein JW809_18910 [Pirellulales bacterium]|nr:hypothetical protein [Pirellulales bacterium]
MKRFAAAMASALLLTALGCGGDGLTAIHGTVTVDGVPLERGDITFEPSDGKGPIAAATITDGKYEAPVTTGQKTVRITGGKVIGKRRFTEHPDSPMIEDVKPLVPPCYNTNTTLRTEITSGQSTYDFELKSSGR